MNPYIIVVPAEDEKGNIKVTREQLQKMVDEAYQRGYEEGKKETPQIVYPTTPYPYPAVTYQTLCSDAAKIAMPSAVHV